MNGSSTIHRMETTAVRCLEIGLLLFWTLWSAALCLAGIWMWTRPGGVSSVIGVWLGVGTRAAAPLVHWGRIAAIAGAQFLFMFLVADDLCPDAPMVVSRVPEVFTATLALGALARTIWLLWNLIS